MMEKSPKPPIPPPVETPPQSSPQTIIYQQPPPKRGFFDGSANCLAGIILIVLALFVAACLCSGVLPAMMQQAVEK